MVMMAVVAVKVDTRAAATWAAVAKEEAMVAVAKAPTLPRLPLAMAIQSVRLSHQGATSLSPQSSVAGSSRQTVRLAPLTVRFEH